jgi:hypothetical protein
MKIITVISSILFAIGLLVSTTVVADTSLNILNQTGVEKIINAGNLRTITFSGSNLNLNYFDGRSDTVILTSIRKMYFNQLTALKKTSQSLTSILIYPNPVVETLYLKNLPDGIHTVAIWNITGRKVMNVTLSSESCSIDVSTLASGFYFLRINSQTLRFSKK